MLKRRKKEPRNLFRSGQPVRLERTIEIESFISREEFIEANRQITQQLVGGKNRWTFILAFVLAVLIISKFVLTQSKPVETPQIIRIIFGIIIFVGLVFWFSKRITKSSAGRVYDTTEFMKSKMKHIFTPETYETVSPVTNAKANWGTLHSYMLLDKFILLYTGLTVAYFIKKSDFKPDDLATFERFLETNFDVKKGLM